MMNSGSIGKQALLTGALVVGSLGFVLGRMTGPPTADNAPFAHVEPEARASDTNSGPGVERPKPLAEVAQGAALVSQRQEILKPILEPEPEVVPEEGTAEAVFKMLDDPAFQVACAQPSGADAEVLSYLVAEARKIEDAFRSAESGRRVEAGLAERLKDYIPGETYTTPPQKRGGDAVSYQVSNSDAFSIVFPRDEYPYMYALQDQRRLLEEELKRREADR